MDCFNTSCYVLFKCSVCLEGERSYLLVLYFLYCCEKKRGGGRRRNLLFCSAMKIMTASHSFLHALCLIQDDAHLADAIPGFLVSSTTITKTPIFVSLFRIFQHGLLPRSAARRKRQGFVFFGSNFKWPALFPVCCLYIYIQTHRKIWLLMI